MLLRLVLYASLALLSLRLSAAPTISMKNGCAIDPDAACPSHGSANGEETIDGGFIDPNG